MNHEFQCRKIIVPIWPILQLFMFLMYKLSITCLSLAPTMQNKLSFCGNTYIVPFFMYYVCNFLPCPIFVPRRDDFNLPIVHFPLLCSIPAAPAWWVQSSQLIRCSRVSGAYHNFLTANKEATESKGPSSFTVVAITWLTITGYLPQMTRICSACLSYFMWSKPCCSFMDIFII